MGDIMNSILIIIGIIMMIVSALLDDLKYPDNLALLFIGTGIALYGACDVVIL